MNFTEQNWPKLGGSSGRTTRDSGNGAQTNCPNEKVPERTKPDSPPEPKSKLDRLADEIRNLLQLLEQDVWEVGAKLAEARGEFGEDDKGFGQWCCRNFPQYHRDTLLRYRLLAEVFGNRQEEVEHIPQSALYELAAPRAEDVRDWFHKDAEIIDLLDEAMRREPGNPTGANQHAVGTFDNVQGSSAPTGNSKEATLRRLRKDRPDLLERVTADELSACSCADSLKS